MTTRVLIADDQAMVRAGFRLILSAEPDLEVVAEAPDGEVALDSARRLRPDVCLVDIRMPRMDGLELTRRLAGPGVEDPLKVVVVTTFDLDEHVHAALRGGASGFLLKDAGPALLIEAVRAAARGDALVSPQVTARLLAHFARASAGDEPPPDAGLTPREEEVLLAVARGRTNQEIAGDLFVSLSTVKTHIASLQEKLGARNRVELTAWAYRSGRMTD